jgi:exodeoxyribonuclease V alpha subunit
VEEQALRLEGTVESLIFENQDTGYTVFELSGGGELFVVCGTVGEVHIGETVVCHGRFETHPTYGRQFHAESCEADIPRDEEAVYAYLSSGSLPYIGAATAKKIMERFGAAALDVIANDPEQLACIRGLSPDKARRIGAEFKRMFGVRELIAWLAPYDISAPRAVELYRALGPGTLEAVSANPYLLCGDPLHIPFRRADQIAAALELPEDSGLRVRAALLYVLRHNANNGHTCVPRARLTDTAAAFIGQPAEAVAAALDGAVADGEIAQRVLDGAEFAFLPDLLAAEQDIAWHLAGLLRLPVHTPRHFEKNLQVLELTQGFAYAPAQQQAIDMALRQNCLVLTGGPGTGKTTAVNAILALLEQEAERVALCAPTGRAAKRLSELTGRKASTIHRLLEVDYTGGVVRFIHNEKNLLRCDVVVLDEMSMVDVKLFQSLLAALRPACRIIMVGDADQLPSVGPGNILGEILRGGQVPSVCLTEIFRQAARSRIVENAHHIVQGEPLSKNGREDDFFFLEAAGERCQQLVCDLVAVRLPKSYGLDPIADIQVLCPTKLGLSGTQALNAKLQALLNPPAHGKPQIEAAGRTFRAGDKVMQVRNNYEIVWQRDGGEQGVGAYNGDIGIVESVNPRDRSLVVRMDDRRILYPADNLGELEIAYAITIHKSQGSEFPAVVLPAAEVPQRLCYRNLLYTGVTRARRLCVVAGQRATLTRMIENARQNLRYSALACLLAEECAAPGAAKDGADPEKSLRGTGAAANGPEEDT